MAHAARTTCSALESVRIDRLPHDRCGLSVARPLCVADLVESANGVDERIPDAANSRALHALHARVHPAV